MASGWVAHLRTGSPSPTHHAGRPNTLKPLPAGSPRTHLHGHTPRRTAAAALLATAFLAGSPLASRKPALSFEFGLTAPEQTQEEAEAGVKVHSRGLLRLRPLVASQAWRELQLALRDTSSRLKQDLYTIIQSKPGDQRPELRKLYSHLFNSVTRLDYAARSKDADLVQERYRNVVASLEEIMSRI